MTRQEAISYIAGQISQKAVDLVPAGCLGSIKTTYKKEGANVFMAFGTDVLSLTIAADVFSSANVRVTTRVQNRSGHVHMETEDFVYHFGEGHSRTDIKRWCVDRFVKKAQNAIDVFRAEITKAG